MRSWYTHFDAYQREHIDGALSFALAQLNQKILWKTLSCFQVPPYWLFWPLWRHFWPDLKMTTVKVVELVRSYPMPLTTCLYLAWFSRSPGGGAVIRHSPSVLMWLRPLSVRGLTCVEWPICDFKVIATLCDQTHTIQISISSMNKLMYDKVLQVWLRWLHVLTSRTCWWKTGGGWILLPPPHPSGRDLKYFFFILTHLLHAFS